MANGNHGLLNAGEYRETLSWAIRKGHQTTRKKGKSLLKLQFEKCTICSSPFTNSVSVSVRKKIVIMAILSLTSSYANWANKCVFTETSLDGELTSQLFTVKLGRGRVSGR